MPEVGYFARHRRLAEGRRHGDGTSGPRADGAAAGARARWLGALLAPAHPAAAGASSGSSATPSVMSGLSFTPDGALLYLVAADVDSQGAFMSRLWRVDARTGEVLRTWEIQDGMGGSITPDGTGLRLRRREGRHGQPGAAGSGDGPAWSRSPASRGTSRWRRPPCLRTARAWCSRCRGPNGLGSGAARRGRERALAHPGRALQLLAPVGG